jgi:hypothetical protein
MPKKKTTILPTWAPRVKPYLIRRLYESDAQGILDLELLETVGWGLYSRCDSFLLAAQARQGKVPCPACGTIILLGSRPKGILNCPVCGWECSSKDYLDTLKNQQLNGGPEVVALFQHYVDEFPQALEPTRKMLLIDELIHGFHHFLVSGRTRRSVGINLISGHMEFVVDFLDHLSYGPGSTPGVQETLQQWQEKIHSQAAGKRKTRRRPDAFLRRLM